MSLLDDIVLYKIYFDKRANNLLDNKVNICRIDSERGSVMKTWKDVRTDLGMSQRDFSDALGMTVAAWSRKENYKREVKIAEACRIIELYFGKTGQYLRIGTDIKI